MTHSLSGKMGPMIGLLCALLCYQASEGFSAPTSAAFVHLHLLPTEWELDRCHRLHRWIVVVVVVADPVGAGTLGVGPESPH